MEINRPKTISTLIIVTALGYFVDIYDLVLFSIVRIKSLQSIGVPTSDLLNEGVFLINAQMIGMLVGGIIWGILADKLGRLKVLFGSILLYSLANIANAFVIDINTYAIIRFIAGIGLAGELGAGITLVSESMTKENRGYGTMIVASIGLLGAVFAAIIGANFTWQTAYLIGGVLGLLLLLLRVNVFESSMFNQLKDRAISKGNFMYLFKSKKRIITYLSCILIGLPVWFVVGILITFSPEIGMSIGINETISVGQAIMYCYLGLALGDVCSGLMSQLWKTRKKIIIAFLVLTLISSSLFLFGKINSAQQLYWMSLLVGFAVGYWALFVTVASEHFGTNIRGTVTSTVPNFVRGAVVPLTLSFTFAKNYLGVLNAAFIIGMLSIIIALIAAFQLDETFGKDLDYLEE